ncbi:TolC family protein [Shewanella algidipiscicola]|uniref:TolC family protein n=1 Tax=Shewanella algidipiscicola TaxID=614070 RepID=UPI000D78B836|nr:TolC family protein [Shewanella algidipiscicola]
MQKSIIAALLLASCSGSVVHALPSGTQSFAPALAQINNSTPPFQAWLPELLQQFNQLPQIKAQQAKLKQAELMMLAADNAVYNPALDVSYEDGVDQTYGIGISQTLDWGDKRGAATRTAMLQAEILRSDVALSRSQALAELLLAIVEQRRQGKILHFQMQQLDAAQRQLTIAKQQLQAGLLSQAEHQLIQLELASRAAEHAMVEQEAIAADAKVLMLVGTASVAFNDFITALSVDDSRYVIRSEVTPELPALKGAYQQVLLAKWATEQVKADTAADPTISFGAEREGDDNKFTLGLSVPLHLRNNYRDTHAVASSEVAVAEQNYLAQVRVISQQQQLFQLSFPRLQQRYEQWRQLVLSSSAGIADALGQQWQAGDISTSDYLQSQRQLASSYLAGLSLESALYQAWLDWMGASGQLEHYLTAQLSLPAHAKASK